MSEIENKEAVELNMSEMEGVVGGYTKPANKAGFILYQVQRGDTLIKIANRHKISDWRKIKEWNPKINDKNTIYTGDWLYLKIGG